MVCIEWNSYLKAVIDGNSWKASVPKFQRVLDTLLYQFAKNGAGNTDAASEEVILIYLNHCLPGYTIVGRK
jgi:hypothetical protein